MPKKEAVEKPYISSLREWKDRARILLRILVNGDTIGTISPEERKKEALQMAEYDKEHGYDTIEVCHECFEIMRGKKTRGYNLVSTEAMSPSAGVYHLAIQASSSSDYNRCLHHYSYDTACGRYFTTFIDSGD